MLKILKIVASTYSLEPKFYLGNLNKKCRKSSKPPKMNSKIQKSVRVSGPKETAKKLKTHKKIPRIYLENPKKKCSKFKKLQLVFFSTQILFGKSE